MHIHNCDCGTGAGDIQHGFDVDLPTGGCETKVIVEFLLILPMIPPFDNLTDLASGLDMFVFEFSACWPFRPVSFVSLPRIDANRCWLTSGVFRDELAEPLMEAFSAEEFPLGWGSVWFGTTGNVIYADSPARALADRAVGFFDEGSGDEDAIKEFGPEIQFSAVRCFQTSLDFAGHVVRHSFLSSVSCNQVRDIRSLSMQLDVNWSEACGPSECRFQKLQREILLTSKAMCVNDGNPF